MANMPDIKRRIKSVKGTQQTTKAMNLVSAAKLGKAKQSLFGIRPFYEETKRIMVNIMQNADTKKHPFTAKREIKNTLVIIINGDRGLCGGYNSNIIKEVTRLTEGKNLNYITIGKKSTEYYTQREAAIVKSFTGISEKPIYEDAARIGNIALNLYEKGEVDEVLLAYTQFESTISHIPTVVQMLPLNPEEFVKENTEKKAQVVMVYEPSEDVVLSYVIPKYVNTIILGALKESAACEQGARMTSMDSATKSASEAIDKMTILYNRARQAAITQEITEIVGGANALT